MGSNPVGATFLGAPCPQNARTGGTPQFLGAEPPDPQPEGCAPGPRIARLRHCWWVGGWWVGGWWVGGWWVGGWWVGGWWVWVAMLWWVAELAVLVRFAWLRRRWWRVGMVRSVGSASPLVAGGRPGGGAGCLGPLGFAFAGGRAGIGAPRVARLRHCRGVVVPWWCVAGCVRGSLRSASPSLAGYGAESRPQGLWFVLAVVAPLACGGSTRLVRVWVGLGWARRVGVRAACSRRVVCVGGGAPALGGAGLATAVRAAWRAIAPARRCPVVLARRCR